MITPSTFEFTTINQFGEPSSKVYKAAVHGDFSFTPDLWVPAIQQTAEAQTISEHVQAFGGLAISLATLHQRFYLQGGQGTLEAKPPSVVDLSARFQYDVQADTTLQLGRTKSIKADGLTIGLNKPVTGKNNAFAVVDEVVRNGTGKRKPILHEVFRNPDEEASERVKAAGAVVVSQTCTYLDSRYPKYGLLGRLKRAGIRP